jgi:DNA-directed RNA polymerase specialized sigma24 family protein
LTGDADARRRLLELTHDRLTRHARSLLHGRYARLEPFAQTADVVQQLYLKILRNQDRFWVNARGQPVRSLAEFFGYASAWMRAVLCDLLRKGLCLSLLVPRRCAEAVGGPLPWPAVLTPAPSSRSAAARAASRKVRSRSVASNSGSGLPPALALPASWLAA